MTETALKNQPIPLAERRQRKAEPEIGAWRLDCISTAGDVDPLWCQRFALDPCHGPDHRERWSQRIHPDDLDEFRHAVDKLCSGAASEIEIEYRVLTRENSWLWLLQRGRVTRSTHDGVALAASGIYIDINKRKRVELELKANETRLSTALWGAQAALWQWHLPSGTCVRSPLWYATTGYTRENWESVPQPWLSRIHPDDSAAVLRELDAHIAGRLPALEFQYRLRCANGAWKWFMDRARTSEWDGEGAPLALIGVSLDIDQQRRTEHSLRATESRLETALWGAGFGLFELDCSTGVGRWLSDWCERYDIEACSGEDHLARRDALVHADDRDAFVTQRDLHIGGYELQYESRYRIRTRSGAWCWIHERGRVVERAVTGRALRLIGICMESQQPQRDGWTA